jgi:hypothetical protein
MFRTVTLPLLKHFGIEEDLELKVTRDRLCSPFSSASDSSSSVCPASTAASCPQINKRGAAPKGGGEILFRCPVVRTLKPCTLVDPGKMVKIRGIVYLPPSLPPSLPPCLPPSVDLLFHCPLHTLTTNGSSFPDTQRVSPLPSAIVWWTQPRCV